MRVQSPWASLINPSCAHGPDQSQSSPLQVSAAEVFIAVVVPSWPMAADTISLHSARSNDSRSTPLSAATGKHWAWARRNPHERHCELPSQWQNIKRICPPHTRFPNIGSIKQSNIHNSTCTPMRSALTQTANVQVKAGIELHKTAGLKRRRKSTLGPK